MVKVIFTRDARYRVRRTVLAYKAGRRYNIPRKIAEILVSNGSAREITDSVPSAEIQPESPAPSVIEVDDDRR